MKNLQPQCKKLIFHSLFRKWYLPLPQRKSQEFIDSRIAEYYAATGDSSVIKKINEEFGMYTKAPEGIKFGDMALLDKNKNSSTLETLLDSLKGKVLYVDFWASWCAPCIGNLPHSVKLAKEYKDKDVAFVYLAFNDNFDKWTEAMKSHGIDGHGAVNYFIVDAGKSDLVKKLSINAIPRYVIFDKNGKIVEPDAPRPGSKEIRGTLDKYLGCNKNPGGMANVDRQ